MKVEMIKKDVPRSILGRQCVPGRLYELSGVCQGAHNKGEHLRICAEIENGGQKTKVLVPIVTGKALSMNTIRLFRYLDVTDNYSIVEKS